MGVNWFRVLWGGGLPEACAGFAVNVSLQSSAAAFYALLYQQDVCLLCYWRLLICSVAGSLLPSTQISKMAYIAYTRH